MPSYGSHWQPRQSHPPVPASQRDKQAWGQLTACLGSQRSTEAAWTSLGYLSPIPFVRTGCLPEGLFADKEQWLSTPHGPLSSESLFCWDPCCAVLWKWPQEYRNSQPCQMISPCLSGQKSILLHPLTPTFLSPPALQHKDILCYNLLFCSL